MDVVVADISLASQPARPLAQHCSRRKLLGSTSAAASFTSTPPSWWGGGGVIFAGTSVFQPVAPARPPSWTSSCGSPTPQHVFGRVLQRRQSALVTLSGCEADREN